MNNYKQALKILATEPQLRATMKARGVSAEDFDEWLREESEYLTALAKEPVEEGLNLDYLQKLLELERLECVSVCFR